MPLEEPRMARSKQTSVMGSVTRAWMSFSMTLGRLPAFNTVLEAVSTCLS